MAELWSMEGGGTLSLREEGLQVRLEAVRPSEGQGLYKAWLRDRTDASFWDPPSGTGETAVDQTGEPLQPGACRLLAGRGRSDRAVLRFGVGRRSGRLASGGGAGAPVPGSVGTGKSAGAVGLLRQERGGGSDVISAVPAESALSPSAAVLLCQAGDAGGTALLVWTFDWEGNPIFSRIGQDGTGHTEQAEKSPEESVL